MKKLLFFLLFLPIIGISQSWNDLKQATKKINKEILQQNAFSEKEARSAIKEVLRKGTIKGVNILSKNDGYFGYPMVKIPFPNHAKEISEKLIQLGMKKQVNDVVLSINRAAEDAAISAKQIFIDAIKKMSIKDAINIVKGNKTAGTDYLNKSTNSALISAFKPIIKSSLQKVNATKYWKSILITYNKIPFVKKVDPKLETYVTKKAIEGLFFVLAKEEIAIRENPKERTSKILKKVFGN
tara:strand:+ start:753 stop:1472 length:720 start_codon:yes stop_codon:yes gene_type:complete